MQYRSAIYELLTTIVTNAQTKSIAIKSIRQYANENIPAQDQERFIEQLDTELLSLHKGNFGRYKITPKQFERWLAVW